MIINSVNIVCCEHLCTHVQGRTCLHTAAEGGRTDIAKYLLDNTRLCEQVDILDDVRYACTYKYIVQMYMYVVVLCVVLHLST